MGNGDARSRASVATHAKGSVRDAMSLLEQVAALGGGSVESETVARALGLADRDAFSRLAVAISSQDAPGALSLVSELAARGGDLRRFVAEAMGFFRGVFLAQYAPNLEEIADEPIDVIDEWRDRGESVGLLKIRTFRPFPIELVREALRGVPKVGVVDRNICPGFGGIFAQEIKASM